jgi:signal transduction histidine kinase
MTSGRLAPTIAVMPAKSDPHAQRRLRLVLDEYERERGALAHELHEQVAQALAAVLLGLDGLASGTGSGDCTSNIAAVRERVAETLEYCTNLAVGLRPPLLDELGLVPALEALAHRTGVVRVDVDRALADVELGATLQTDVYRMVEGALAAVGGNRDVTVSLHPALCELTISVRPLDADTPVGELGPLETRLVLIGGTLAVGSGKLVVRIPIEPGVGGAIAAFPQPRRVENPDGERRALP